MTASTTSPIIPQWTRRIIITCEGTTIVYTSASGDHVTCEELDSVNHKELRRAIREHEQMLFIPGRNRDAMRRAVEEAALALPAENRHERRARQARERCLRRRNKSC